MILFIIYHHCHHHYHNHWRELPNYSNCCSRPLEKFLDWVAHKPPPPPPNKGSSLPNGGAAKVVSWQAKNDIKNTSELLTFWHIFQFFFLGGGGGGGGGHHKFQGVLRTPARFSYSSVLNHQYFHHYAYHYTIISITISLFRTFNSNSRDR